MNQILAEIIVRHRRLILALLLLTTPIAVAIALRIQFDFTPQALFAGNEELVNYSEDFKNAFAHEDNVILVVLEAVGENDVLSVPALRWQTELAARINRLPGIIRIESLPTVIVPRFGISGVSARPLVRSLEMDEDDAQRIREIIDRQELIQNVLVSADRRCAALAGFVDPALRDVETISKMVGEVEDLLDRYPCPDGFQTHICGLPAVRVDIVRNLRDDQRKMLPLCFAVFFVLTCFLFRNVSGVLLPGLSVVIGLTWAIAALVLLGQKLNIITNVLPTLLLVVGVSNCVHVMSRFAEEARQSQDRLLVARRAALSHMALACLLTSLTTAIGFLSLLAAESDLLNAFGWQAAMGMGLFYLSTMLVCGSLMPVMSAPRMPSTSEGSQLGIVSRVVSRMADMSDHHPWRTLAVALVIVAVALWSARNVVIDSYLIETFDEDHPTIRTIRLVENQLGGFVPMEISLEASDDETLLLPATLAKVAAVQGHALARDEVLSVTSYADLFRAVDRDMPGNKRLQQLPAIADDDASRRRIDRIEEMIEDLGPRIGYRYFMTPDRRRARIVMKIRDVGTRQGLVLIRAVQEQLEKSFPSGGPIEARLTGDAYVASLAMDSFIRDLFHSLMGASVAIFLVIGLLFRSLRIGLISILPNMTPLLVTLGYMGLRGYEMNTGNIIVFAISLGIAVDDTIHFLARFREESHRQTDVTSAIRATCLGAGRAIVMTSFLIVAGLSILYISEFVPTRRFAELTSVTMLAALLGDLLLLPACLMLFWRTPRTAA